MKSRSHRAGFAMMLVLVFLVLYLGILGVALRQTASALRIETVRSNQVRRDEGSIHAVAQGIQLLKSGIPPADLYVCGVNIVTSSGLRYFKLTFAREGTGGWSVRAEPAGDGETFDPIPVMFP